MAGTPRSWEQTLLAACLWADGTASHRSAAALWKLDGTKRKIIEITTPRDLRANKIKVHTGCLAPEEVTSVGPINVTTVARTLLDLGAVVEPQVVQGAVTDALRQKLITPERLQRYLRSAGGRGRRGAKTLRSIVAALGDRRPESVLELRLIRVLRRSGLPEPISQFSIRRGQKVVARVDLAYPEIRLAIEADSYRYHGGSADWRRDLARRNELTGLGWRVIHVTWDDVTRRPATVIRQVRIAIRQATRREPSATTDGIG